MAKLLTILFIAVSLSACGDNEDPQTFIIQGEPRQCTVLSQTECGLTVACENAGIFECVTN